MSWSRVSQLCFDAAQIWLEAPKQCSVQDFHLGLFTLFGPLWMDLEKNRMSHSLRLCLRKKVIQWVWKACLLLFLLLSYGVLLHCTCAHQIFLTYIVQRERSLCLLIYESVMNQSGTSEKPYIISLHIIFTFLMLTLHQMIASNSTSHW